MLKKLLSNEDGAPDALSSPPKSETRLKGN